MELILEDLYEIRINILTDLEIELTKLIRSVLEINIFELIDLLEYHRRLEDSLCELELSLYP